MYLSLLTSVFTIVREKGELVEQKGTKIVDTTFRQDDRCRWTNGIQETDFNQ
jgi:hypothetical protein